MSTLELHPLPTMFALQAQGSRHAPLWVTSRYGGSTFWHRGYTYEVYMNGSPHYYYTQCGNGVGATPHVFDGEVPPEEVALEGGRSERRRLCVRCVMRDRTLS